MDITTDPALIRTQLEPFIAADPVRATVLGTIAVMVADPPADAAPWCASVPGGVAARSQTRTPVSLLGQWEDCFDDLLEALLELRPASLNGPQRLVDPLAQRLLATVASQRARIDERLFRLDELVAPQVSGSPRRADDADTALLVEWWQAFAAEAHDTVPPQDVAEIVQRAVRLGGQWLWIDGTGEPVSMAAARAPVSGCARVGPVYTPPSLRGRGFASAVTAIATREILDVGAVPVLFTDRSNPTSNKIYQRLGYRAVEDYAFVSWGWPE